jgi:hypothetical protein
MRGSARGASHLPTRVVPSSSIDRARQDRAKSGLGIKWSSTDIRCSYKSTRKRRGLCPLNVIAFLPFGRAEGGSKHTGQQPTFHDSCVLWSCNSLRRPHMYIYVCVCSSRHLVLLNGLYSARRLSVLSPCRTQLPDRCPDASFGGPGGGGAPLYQTETRPGNGHVHPGQALPAGVGVERGRPSGFSNETAPCHMPCDVQRPNYSTQRCPQHRCSMPVGHLPVVARSVKKAISRPSAWQELKSLDCNPHDKKGDSAPKTAFL